MKCREGHDRPKSEVLCCSMHKPGDLLYNKGFTKCRSLELWASHWAAATRASTATERPSTRPETQWSEQFLFPTG